MEWTKVKAILIVLLLVVNVFLAVNLFYVVSGEGGLSKETMDNLLSALKQNGINIDEKILSDFGDFYEVDLKDVDISIPENLKGNITLSSDGGFEYRSEFTLNEGENSGERLLKFLSDQGFTVENYKSEVSASQAGYWISLNRYFLSRRVLNTTIMANLTKNELLCWGRTPFYDIYPVSKIDSELLPDALIKFSVYVKKNYNLGINITEIEQAYEASYSSNRIQSVSPVLVVKTDIGEFVYNLDDGTIEKKG